MRLRQRLMGRGDAHREELLRGIEMFSGLGPRQLRRLARLCVARDYVAGEWLIHQGDTGLGMFILVRGTAEVLQGEGERQLRLATLSAGDCVGEMSLIDTGPRSASVRVLEDLHCLLITRDSFNALAQRDAAILWGMVPLLVKRLRETSQRIAALSQGGDPLLRGSAVTGSVKIEKTGEVDVDLPIQEAADDSPETDDLKSVLTAGVQLFSASFFFHTSLLLIGIQENLRLIAGKEPVRERLDKSEEVVSSLTTHIEEKMGENTRKVYDVHQDFLDFISSIFGR